MESDSKFFQAAQLIMERLLPRHPILTSGLDQIRETTITQSPYL